MNPVALAQAREVLEETLWKNQCVCYAHTSERERTDAYAHSQHIHSLPTHTLPPNTYTYTHAPGVCAATGPANLAGDKLAIGIPGLDGVHDNTVARVLEHVLKLRGQEADPVDAMLLHALVQDLLERRVHGEGDLPRMLARRL